MTCHIDKLARTDPTHQMLILELVMYGMLYRCLYHAQSRVESSSEPARMNLLQLRGQGSKSSKPDIMSHQEVYNLQGYLR
jgi:hypothetical protein